MEDAILISYIRLLHGCSIPQITKNHISDYVYMITMKTKKFFRLWEHSQNITLNVYKYLKIRKSGVLLKLSISDQNAQPVFFILIFSLFCLFTFHLIGQMTEEINFSCYEYFLNFSTSSSLHYILKKKTLRLLF